MVNYDTFLKELKQAGLDVVHEQVQIAMSFYHKDPTQCCLCFRYALEAVLLTVYELANQNPPSSNKERINYLEELVSGNYLPQKVIQEMHQLRTVSNRYHHFPLDVNNPEKDRLTCRCSMEPISEWIVDLSANPDTWLVKEKASNYLIYGEVNAMVDVGARIISIAMRLSKKEVRLDIRELFKKRLRELGDYDE